MTPFEITMGGGLGLTTADILTSLLLALALGIVVARVYRASVPGRLVSPSLQASMVVLSMVGAMVILVVGSNVARAFALVGALGIVRFRTRLRSPWDITFVFFALAVGVACGVLAYSVALLGTLVVSLGVLTLQVIPLGGVDGEIHTLRCDLAAYQTGQEAMLEVLDRHIHGRWLIEARSVRFGETLSYRYRIALDTEAGIEAMLRELSALDGVERVVFGAGAEGMDDAD